MRLLRLAEIQTNTRDRVFRYSLARALLLALVVVCASTGLVLVVWRELPALAYYIAGVFLFGLVLMRGLILARFQPTNWLVRMNDDGVLIKFRSYLNYHLPAEDRTVAFIPYEEILSARLVRERAKVASYSGKVSTQTRRLVEFELAGDPAPLTKALAEEFARRPPQEKHWYGRTATLYKHFPAHMVSPSFLQVEWSVVPGTSVFLEGLRRYTTIAAPIELSQDFFHLQGMGRDEQEKRLRELAERGQTIFAIYIARRLYSYNLNQAQTFVEGLLGGKEMAEPVITGGELNSAPPRRTRMSAVLAFFGLFLGLCATFALSVAGVDIWKERAQSGWPTVSAVVDRGEVAEYHPFVRHGGGTVWYLRYRVSYAVQGRDWTATITSRSSRSGAEVAKFRAWSAKHRAHTLLDIRYDPSDPRHVVFASTGVPNSGPRATSDFRLAVMFAVGSTILLVLSRIVRRPTHREACPPARA